VWAILRTLVQERKKREVDPTLSVLRDLLLQAPQSDAEAHAQARMRDMLAPMELLTKWYDDVERLETERLIQLLGLGATIVKALDAKDRLFALPGRKAAAKSP
jgi:DNA-binding transcriptional regulator GbsR (MarR family)